MELSPSPPARALTTPTMQRSPSRAASPTLNRVSAVLETAPRNFRDIAVSLDGPITSAPTTLSLYIIYININICIYYSHSRSPLCSFKVFWSKDVVLYDTLYILSYWNFCSIYVFFFFWTVAVEHRRMRFKWPVKDLDPGLRARRDGGISLCAGDCKGLQYSGIMLLRVFLVAPRARWSVLIRIIIIFYYY